MRALWFLTWRLLVHSIRRTLRHPVRAVVFALTVGWFGFVMVASMVFAIAPRMPNVTQLPPDFMTINMEALIALIMAAHLAVLWQPLSPWMGFTSLPLFTQADVHFLFPSPQKRLGVFLFLLLTRGVANSLFTLLILAFLVLLIGNELIVNALTGRHPSNIILSWTYPLMYLLAFTGLLFAGILITLREERREGFRRWVGAAFWCVVGLLAGMLGVHGYRAWSAGYEPLQEIVWHALHNPMVAIPLLPLRGLAEAALAFDNGWTPYVTLGFLIWGGFTGGTLWLLVREEGWLYDLAAKMSSLTTAHLLRWQTPAHAAYQDVVSYTASLGTAVPRWRLLEKWTPQGVWALLWCNSLLLWRTAKGMMLSWSLLFSAALTALMLFLQRYEPEMYPFVGVISMYTASFFSLFLTQVLLVAAIRRAEMNKSLPFRAEHIVWMEIVPLTLPVWLLVTGVWGVFCMLFPQEWAMLTAHGLRVLSIVPLWHAGMFLVYLIVPDQSDYIQRVLLGMLLLPVLFLTTLPTLALWGISTWLSLPALMGAAITLMVNAVVVWLVVRIAGVFYIRVILTD